MHQHDGLPDVPVLNGAEPTGSTCGTVLDPRPDRLDDKDVGEACDDGLAARAKFASLRSHEPKGRRQPVDLIEATRLEIDDVGEKPHEMARGGMIESSRAADQSRRRAASSVPQNRIAIADIFMIKLVDAGRRRAGIAEEPVAQSVGDERKVARLKLLAPASHFKPAGTGGDDVEADAIFATRKLQGPRFGQFGPTIEGAGHANEVKDLAERVWLTLCLVHRISMRNRGAQVHRLSDEGARIAMTSTLTVPTGRGGIGRDYDGGGN